MRRSSALLALAITAATIAACGDPGPIAVSIAPLQMASGENRALTAMGDKPEYAPVQEVEYEIGGTLPPVDESAMSFSFQPRSDNKLALRGMADALGVYGDFVKENKNLLTIGYNKLTGAGLQLWVDASGGWWSYNSGAAAVSVVSSSECDATQDCTVSIPADTPPAKNLLTQAQAIKKVGDLLVLSRGKPINYVFSVEFTPWTVQVTGRLRLWRMTSNIEINVLFGENGKIISASGPMVAVKTANTYPLITPQEGVARLKDPMFATGPAVRSIAATSAMETTANTAGTANSALVGSRTISIVDVHLTLMQVLLSNGTYMLLPSYTYFDKEGEVGVVLAVQDKYLVEGSYPTTSVDEAVKPAEDPQGEETPGSPGSGQTPSQPGIAPVVPLTDDNSIVLMGHSETEVNRVCEQNGWIVRVVQRDDEVFRVTEDYVENRLNIRVMKGIVTGVTIG